MGGKAFDDVQPIEQHLIDPTIKYLQSLMGPFKHKRLGSTGKKPISGDIDLAVSSEEWTYEQLVDSLNLVLGYDNVNTQGYQFNQVYTRVTVNTVPHQVDFMVGDMNLLEFTHWSPLPNTSQYTGSHRTELVKAIAKALSNTAVKEGKVLARVGYTLHHDKGLTFGARWCAPRKDGAGYVVKMTEVKDEDIQTFKDHFPELNFSKTETFTDPNVICQKLFGADVTPDQVNSYEQISELISASSFLKEKSDLIWNLYTERLREIKLIEPNRLV